MGQNLSKTFFYVSKMFVCQADLTKTKRVRVKESKHFFTEDVAPRWASNLRPLHGNYRDE